MRYIFLILLCFICGCVNLNTLDGLMNAVLDCKKKLSSERYLDENDKAFISRSVRCIKKYKDLNFVFEADTVFWVNKFHPESGDISHIIWDKSRTNYVQVSCSSIWEKGELIDESSKIWDYKNSKFFNDKILNFIENWDTTSINKEVYRFYYIDKGFFAPGGVIYVSRIIKSGDKKRIDCFQFDDFGE